MRDNWIDLDFSTSPFQKAIAALGKPVLSYLLSHWLSSLPNKIIQSHSPKNPDFEAENHPMLQRKII